MAKVIKGSINLGDLVRDVYTGFTGTAIARTEWLHGCVRITVEPTKLIKGMIAETTCIDEARLRIVKRRAVINTAPELGPAGPRTAVSRGHILPKQARR